MKKIEELFRKIIFSNLNKNISLFNDFEKFDNISYIRKKIRKFFKVYDLKRDQYRDESI